MRVIFKKGNMLLCVQFCTEELTPKHFFNSVNHCMRSTLLEASW